MSYMVQSNENKFPFCNLEYKNFIKREKSLKVRMIWCLFLSIIVAIVSPSVFALWDGVVNSTNAGDLYIEMICVTLIFICGANNFIIITYFKFKDRLANSKDLLLFIVALTGYVVSIVDIIDFDSDVYALRFILTIDILVLVAWIRLFFVKNSHKHISKREYF